jgi:hypothetical protein
MKKLITLLTFSSLILSACAQEEKPQDDAVPQLLEVAIKTEDSIQVNQETIIKAVVTQGKNKVTNADEVKFEISKAGDDQHEMMQGKHQKDGVYSIQKTFKDGGQYYIVAHVTANRMHSMPRKEILVGDANHTNDQEETNKAAENDQSSHENDQSDHSHDHASKLEYEFDNHGPYKVNEETELTVYLKSNGLPLEGAQVRFEIWKDNQHQHDYFDATEVSAAKYALPYTFTLTGLYNLKIHVEKDEIHDHTTDSVEIK